MRYLISTITLIILSASALASSDVETIKLTSSWGGLGPFGKSELLITRKDGRYYANGRRIDGRLIDDLITALDSPIVENPNLTNIGIIQVWLDSNAEDALKESSYFRSDLSEKQRELFISSFKNYAFLEDVLRNYFSSWWTDDYPQFDIEITRSPGNTIRIYSKAQHLFMIPWQIAKDQQVFLTYNADISRAIARLLPKKFTNRDRLSGDSIRDVLAERVMWRIKDQWNLLDTEKKIGNQLDVLKGRYALRTSMIGSLSSIDVESFNSKGGYESWNATLTRNDLPSNVYIGVSIPYKKGRLTSLDIFQQRIDYFTDLALSVSWLNEYISKHPEIEVELRFVEDRSLSRKAVETFREDMKNLGKNEFLEQIADHLKDSAFLEVSEKGCWSRWIALPDRRMILWQFKCDRVLNWNATEFETRGCYGWNCAGALISQSGRLLTGKTNVASRNRALSNNVFDRSAGSESRKVPPVPSPAPGQHRR